MCQKFITQESRGTLNIYLKDHINSFYQPCTCTKLGNPEGILKYGMYIIMGMKD